jgi:hypothetical protein
MPQKPRYMISIQAKRATHLHYCGLCIPNPPKTIRNVPCSPCVHLMRVDICRAPSLCKCRLTDLGNRSNSHNFIRQRSCQTAPNLLHGKSQPNLPDPLIGISMIPSETHFPPIRGSGYETKSRPVLPWNQLLHSRSTLAMTDRISLPPGTRWQMQVTMTHCYCTYPYKLTYMSIQK